MTQQQPTKSTRRGSPTITVRMPQTLIDRIKQAAAESGKTLTDVVREACETHLREA